MDTTPGEYPLGDWILVIWDSSKIARQLIRLESVEELFVTEGDYGFVVKAAEEDSKGDSLASALASKYICYSYSTARGHYYYIK